MSVSQVKLTGHELANILDERHGWPQTIGAVAILEGAGFHGAPACVGRKIPRPSTWYR